MRLEGLPDPTVPEITGTRRPSTRTALHENNRRLIQAGTITIQRDFAGKQVNLRPVRVVVVQRHAHAMLRYVHAVLQVGCARVVDFRGRCGDLVLLHRICLSGTLRINSGVCGRAFTVLCYGTLSRVLVD